jgi:tripartite-type tricarboxylate transporter receptor subunit TctC
MKNSVIATSAIAFMCIAVTAFAQSSNDFCQSKSLTIVVGSPPGGGYDTFGRLIGDHFGKFLPGRCSIVIQNMPGAGSLRAANYLFQQAPSDGMTIGMIQANLVLNQAFNSDNVNYDLRKFHWLGRIDTSVETTVSWRPSPVNTIQDAKTRQITLAAATANGLTAGFPRVMNAIVGTKFKIIPGYGGMAAIGLALERGEVQGGHMTGSMLLKEKRDWLTGNKVSILVQYSQSRDANFPSVPAMVEFAQTPEQKQILSLFAALPDIGRTLLAPPGVTNDRVTALRAAFQSMIKDADFLANTKRRNIELDTLSGEALGMLIDSSLDISPSVAKVAEEAWTKGK